MTRRALKPDMEKVAALDCLGVIATAPGEDSDFVSRFFGPRVEVPEDPVTGSAHCTLTLLGEAAQQDRDVRPADLGPRRRDFLQGPRAPGAHQGPLRVLSGRDDGAVTSGGGELLRPLDVLDWSRSFLARFHRNYALTYGFKCVSELANLDLCQRGAIG